MVSPPNLGLGEGQGLVVNGIDSVWQTVLRADVHTGTQRDQAALAVWDAVDF
jgi:hypothetical protein